MIDIIFENYPKYFLQYPKVAHLLLNFATNFDFINFKRKTKEIHINLFGKTTFFQYTYFDFTNLL